MTTRLPLLALTLGIALTLPACATDDGSIDAPEAVGLFDGGSDAQLQLAEEITYEHLAGHDHLLAGIDEFRTIRVSIDDTGRAHTRLQQLVDGVPVWGGEAIVHLSARGTLERVTDDMIRGLNVDTTPSYSAQEAIELAEAAHGARRDLSEAPTTRLWIFRDKQGVALAWQVRIRDVEDNDAPSIPVIFVDAHTGEVLWQYDDLQSYSLSDADKTTYDLKNSTRYSRASVGDSSDADLLTTHDAIGSTLEFMSTTFGRDSYNGSGAVVRSYGHYSRSYVNAFWDGSRLSFGDGDGYYSTYLGVLDVAAHEFGHAVTDYEADLTYANESGALNEAASDMLAAAVEAYVDGGASSDAWDIGEDCWIEPGTTALRYMSRPSDDGASRDHYSDRYTGSSDSGGVHWNSGIANHWFYLLSEGGQHHDSAFRSGNTVAGLGIDAAYAIWYAALSDYMTSSTNFSGARSATESACAALGYSTADCESVSYAWYEVGVGSDPAGGGGDTGGGDTGGGSTCAGTAYTGTLSGSGDSAIEPGGSYAYYSGGTSGDLTGPAGADFDLYLYRSTGGKFRLADSSTGATSSESVSSGSSAYYYYLVHSYTGSGAYELCVD